MSLGSSTPQSVASGPCCWHSPPWWSSPDAPPRAVRAIAANIGRARSSADGIPTGCVDRRRRHVCGGLGGAAGRSERRVSDPDLPRRLREPRAMRAGAGVRRPGRCRPGVLCLELTRTGVEGDVLALSERLVYRPWMCMPAAFEVHATADGTSRSSRSSGTATCAAGNARLHRRVAACAARRGLGEVAGLGRTTASTALGGATTQYAVAADGSVWFPLEDRGQVARVDAASGEIRRSSRSATRRRSRT